MRGPQNVVILGGRLNGEVIKHEGHYAITIPGSIGQAGFNTDTHPVKLVRLFGKRLYVATHPQLVSVDGALMELLLKPEWFDHWKAAPKL